ncbi:SusC/RagA family TonB-linked outer membrane protein [Riemerella anatipestifer]|uniref:Tonb-dependent receptor plug n=1 Tax=Riemerella anatipestifer (strain ATCC 11845 / DSM 15868 / JCM 9532 / NCTC 11014) TaxID=693978 RepID=E4T8S7_RIEAD|nr:SusC/RagA family TonB-linked outer membrane protein [Riemerella anatipestifer]ADQ82460.1 TonB-dependent receptor plug [Riemerella anatipestifer ATCC 11845 = DSM 15868]ADZ12045.1 TonB-dependent receptor, beta-barrel [Riemerella anatipestifer RA-GD]AFD56466.1 tonb-dependent receptor plug [Riemerella anatipestifer ATCC 11845 = DSM 15868]AKQ39811.1 TonB-dependent receptor [Riemerella anatipestifer Yb2]EFT36864.1 hypothetical protein RAYM_00570 [Riemerella anatipestifer RA-YM]
MNVKLRVLTAGAVFFIGAQSVVAQKAKKDTVKEIEEVVMVAYGKQTKESLTGSVSEVKAKDIKDITTANVVQGMTGKVAGVQIATTNGLPGEEPTVRFRGVGSINGSATPLYVVDGVPFNGNIAAINNADIESMSFLKDASAAALYGSRGANGVVIITTKKGKQGKTRYSFDMKSGVSDRGVPEYNISRSPSQYYEYYYNVLRNQEIHGGATLADAHNSAVAGLIGGANGLGYNITNVANDQIITADGKFNPNASVLYQEDWAKTLFQKGFYTNTFFSASGATNATSFYYSLGYESNETYMTNAKFDKVTARVKADSKLGEKLKFGGNLSYSNMVQNVPDGFNGTTSYSNPFQFSRYIAPIYPVYAYAADGTPIYTTSGIRAFDDGTGRIAPFVRPYAQLQNPYATALYDIKTRKTNQIFASGYGTYSILDGLDFTYTVTGEYNNLRGYSFDTPLYGDAVDDNGRVYNWNNITVALTQQQMLTYNKKFGNLGVEAMLGHETLKRQFDTMSNYMKNGGLLDSPYANHFSVIADASGYGRPYALEGYLARLNLNYAGKYFLNANARRDGSSRFHPDNRWGNFYGFGAAWVVSKEKFLANLSWLNKFKLKASYGEQGNDNLDQYGNNSFYDLPYKDYYRRVTMTTVADMSVLPATTVYRGNKDITWEKNANLNAGFELSLFGNRLNIDAEYFRRKSFDMLYTRPLPLHQGLTVIPDNLGDMENKGVEVTVSVDAIKTQDFNLSFNVNGTSLKNRILRLPNTPLVSGNFILEEGGSMYTWRMREFVGVNPDTGAALFAVLKADGTKTTTETYSDATLINTGKTSVPKYYGGFGINTSYKNFDFTANFAYQLGGWGYDYEWMGLMGAGRGQNFHSDFYNTWSVDNKSANLPVVLPENDKLYYGMSTMGLIKSDYLSLQNVSLGYTFDRDLINSTGIDRLRVYIMSDNVHVWSKRKGYDPRMSYTGSASSSFSPLRTIALGLNVGF